MTWTPELDTPNKDNLCFLLPMFLGLSLKIEHILDKTTTKLPEVILRYVTDNHIIVGYGMIVVTYCCKEEYIV